MLAGVGPWECDVKDSADGEEVVAPWGFKWKFTAVAERCAAGPDNVFLGKYGGACCDSALAADGTEAGACVSGNEFVPGKLMPSCKLPATPNKLNVKRLFL